MPQQHHPQEQKEEQEWSGSLFSRMILEHYSRHFVNLPLLIFSTESAQSESNKLVAKKTGTPLEMLDFQNHNTEMTWFCTEGAGKVISHYFEYFFNRRHGFCQPLILPLQKQCSHAQKCI